MSPGVALLVAALIAYLLGSIPASYIAGRLLRGIDLREHGSGNLGATNVFRTLGPLAAVPVVLVDIAKGALAVWIAQLAPFAIEGSPDAAPLLAAVCAILGHSFSPIVMFAGGKGVATAAGAFLTLAPWGAIPAFGIWILLLLTTRIMSIASLAAAGVLPMALLAHELETRGDGPFRWVTLAAATLVAVFVFVRHRGNIARLRDGSERGLW